jgi:hypothetical protein
MADPLLTTEPPLSIKKVLSLPMSLEAQTLYLCEDASEGLMVAVTDKLGSLIRKTKGHAEIQSMIDSAKAEVMAAIPVVWETLNVDHDETWGSVTYILQSSGSLWRVKKIDADGVLTISASTDLANANLTRGVAWTNRTTLTYS